MSMLVAFRRFCIGLPFSPSGLALLADIRPCIYKSVYHCRGFAGILQFISADKSGEHLSVPATSKADIRDVSVTSALFPITDMPRDACSISPTPSAR
jgi:hypothetical protein